MEKKEHNGSHKRVCSVWARARRRLTLLFAHSPPHFNYCTMDNSLTTSTISTPSRIDVCIFIDPLFDFLSPNGTFCKTYGEDDCVPIISIHKSLNKLYQHLKNHCPSIDIIIVSSVYEATQFETVPNLCTTAEGCKVFLDDCPVDENMPVSGNHTYIQKTTNSFLTCPEESLDRVMQLTANRNI